jgi:hypothetical protein
MELYSTRRSKLISSPEQTLDGCSKPAPSAIVVTWASGSTDRGVRDMKIGPEPEKVAGLVSIGRFRGTTACRSRNFALVSSRSIAQYVRLYLFLR